MSEESAWVRFRYEMAWLRFKLACEKVMDLETKYRADQPRAPAGSPSGGQWVADGAAPARLRQRHKPISYSKQKESLVIPEQLHEKLQSIGEDYTRQTGEVMNVTSGRRTAEGQASAMYEKLREGGSINLYTNKNAANKIKQIYDDGVSSGESKNQTTEKMAIEIRRQMEGGVYISRHLFGMAADIQAENVYSKNARIIKSIARNHGATVILEGKPPHIHIQFSH